MQLPVSHQGNLYYEIVDLTPPWISDPQTIILSHGIGTNSAMWHGWKPILARFFRVVCFDTRGCGRSVQHEVGFPYSFDLWIDDIAAIADAVNAEKFHLVGEAMAGAVAQQFSASKYCQRLLTLTICSAPYRGVDLPSVADWEARLKREGVAAWSVKMMQQRFYSNAIPATEYAWFAAEQQRSHADVLLTLGKCLLEIDFTQTLAKLPIPALVLAADASPYVTPETAATMQQLIPDCELQIFAHSRHGLPFSHGKECAETLLAFLQRRGFTTQ